ncbi:hypothetical protein FA13DRAFT_140015 [Coprinellus micaceus]|uniref:Uncharacterized protein n=1 Tax=Coprinellus micaceus TaxID=71717 RepID=A0A4Y7SJ85_COPMI|nr:hypothetical protein FA13DRAFT_140015 [Coprinellus micaceus]
MISASAPCAPGFAVFKDEEFSSTPSRISSLLTDAMSLAPSSQPDGIRVPWFLVLEYAGTTVATTRMFNPPDEPDFGTLDETVRYLFPDIRDEPELEYYATEIAGFDKVKITKGAWEVIAMILAHVLVETPRKNSRGGDPPTKREWKNTIVHSDCMVMVYQGERVLVRKPPGPYYFDGLVHLAHTHLAGTADPEIGDNLRFYTSDIEGFGGKKVEVEYLAWDTLLPAIRNVTIDTGSLLTPRQTVAGTGVHHSR